MKTKDLEDVLANSGGPETCWTVLTTPGVVYTGTLAHFTDKVLEVDTGGDEYQPIYLALEHVVALVRHPIAPPPPPPIPA